MTETQAQLRVEYFSQLREAAGGVDYERVTLAGSTSVEDLVRGLAAQHGSGFAHIVLASDGGLRPTVLCFVDGRPVQPTDRLAPGTAESLTLLSPLGGG